MTNKFYVSTSLRRSSVAVLLFIVILFIVFLSWSYVTSQSTSPIEKTNTDISIKTSHFIDSSMRLSVEQVFADNDRFTSSSITDIPFALGDAYYWVKFDIKNHSDSSKKLVLHIDNAMLDTAKMYDVSKGIITSGTSINVSSAFPKFLLNIATFENKTLLLKLKAGGPPDIPLHWYTPNSFETKEQFTRLLFGAVIGILFIMALYNFVIYMAIKDKVYLIYIGYLLSAFFVLATVNGYGYLIFDVSVQTWLNQNALVFHYYLVFFLLLFGISFLKFDEQKGMLYKVGMFAVCLLIVLSVATQFLSHQNQVQTFFTLLPFYYVYLLTLLVLRFNKQFYWARFYFLSWLVLIIGSAVQPLVLLNHLEYSFLFKNAFLIAVIIEVVLMSFALAERVRRHEIERVTDISYHPLTGIARKVLLEQAIDALIKQPKAKFSVLVIKPEHIERIALYVNEAKTTAFFKSIHKKLTPLFAYNDAIEQIGKKGEKVAFISGSSFGIIVNHKRNHQALDILIQSINTLIEEAYHFDGIDIPLKAVVGIANYPEHGNEPFILVNRAQLALQEAQLSHSKWAYFTKLHSKVAAEQVKLASSLNEALVNDELALYHQPQIDLKTMRVCGSECLIRWRNGEQGFISPSVFIPIAEDMGLINKLSKWVIKQAIAQHSVLLSQGYKHHMVSINISRKDLALEAFYDDVKAELESADFPANKIIFELTESGTNSYDEQALSTIKKLTELGITVSIDDFGSGYSSMAYISELPFQELKVDRQFVENVCDDHKRKTIAKAIVSMAKSLGLEVVAEGINNELDEKAYRQFGCDIGQGRFYAQPMAFDDYILWLENEINGRPPAPLEGEFIPKDK